MGEFNEKTFCELERITNIEKRVYTKAEILENPSSFSDSNGNWIIKDAIKWFAKNVVEPVVDACEDLLDNVDFKILVKDTTLANGVKEQGERHLFTLNNSRILNN